jgi:hypothetical protein
MVVHSINIFDKRGKILFSKAYSSVATKQERYLLESGTAEPGSDPVTEQKKLIFGMLFSLKELVGNLTPENSRKCKNDFSTPAFPSRNIHDHVFQFCCKGSHFNFLQHCNRLKRHRLQFTLMKH